MEADRDSLRIVVVWTALLSTSGSDLARSVCSPGELMDILDRVDFAG
jgi:hypothetical protein